MKRLLLLLISIFSLGCMLHADETEEKKIYVSGYVRDKLTKADIEEAKVTMLDSKGEIVDSVKMSKFIMRRSRYGIDRESFVYRLSMPRRADTYQIQVEAPGYIGQIEAFPQERVSREKYINGPTFMLERAPHRLGEVEVRTSKVKFYNRGDTLVYNADAFQLSEGSMLDALIAMLPGVTLNDNGEIFVNGEFVEELKLDGRPFMNGNKELLLNNLAAYSVKSVEVYKGQTEVEKWEGRPDAEKHLYMDVRLKKEFALGVMANLQGGYGTSDRYMGKLFLSMFSPTKDLVLIVNSNNLNDNRKPGKSDTWTPDRMPRGKTEYDNVAFNYDIRDGLDKQNYTGYITSEFNSTHNVTTTARTNFLQSGDTYENRFSRDKTRRLKLETRNEQQIINERTLLWNMIVGRYISNNTSDYGVSASFREEQKDMTRRALETLYTSATPEQLASVINRDLTLGDNNRREWEVQTFPTFQYKRPGTNDILRMQLELRYRGIKDWTDRSRTINYGADPEPASRLLQHTDNKPNHRLTLGGNAGYRIRLEHFQFNFEYDYNFVTETKDSYLYELDRLEEEGVFGALPAGWRSTLDPENSYSSRLLENIHSFHASAYYTLDKDSYYLHASFSPEFNLHHRHYDYIRAGKEYNISRTDYLTEVGRYGLWLYFENDTTRYNNRRAYRNRFEINAGMTPKLPDPSRMIDVVNDANPLNIRYGNPGLRKSVTYSVSGKWTRRAPSRHLNNTLSVSAERTNNAIVNGYTYDTATGVRHTRAYNVDGNGQVRATNNFNLQFGPGQCFTLSNSLEASAQRYADMIGIDLSEPVRSKVRTSVLNGGLRLDWQLGSQTIGISGSVMHRHTTSTREDFNTINAQHYSGSLLGQFHLPCGWGINTDFSLYSRHGYGVSEIDKTDPIWNIRVLYTPQHPRLKALTFMVDGFDMLHSLSNVNYAVSASGRTVSYSNALPRYILFSVQYRFFRQPKGTKAKGGK